MVGYFITVNQTLFFCQHSWSVDLSYFMNDICYLYVYGQWDAHPYCYVTITTICVLHKIAFSFNIRTKLIFKSEQIYHICIP